MAEQMQSNDLDQLLDSALDDFQSFNLTCSSQRIGGNEDEKQENSSFPSKIQGLGMMGLPDLESKKKGKQKVSKDSHVEALEKLREQTRESVKGLESVTDQKIHGVDVLGNDPMMEDWVKEFEELAGSQDMESMVETMMQQLLSKEVLYEPMKEIAEKYPKWLEDNKPKLGFEEYEKFSNQFQFIKDLNQVYETDPGNFNKIVDLMQKMQECGQPPSDIVKDLSPDFDLSTFGQLSPEIVDPQQNCCIM